MLWALTGGLTRKAELVLFDALTRVRQRKAKHLLIDLAGLQRMDGAGLSVLVRVLFEAKSHSIYCVACRPEESLANLLRQTHVADVLPLFADPRNALMALDQPDRVPPLGDIKPQRGLPIWRL